jgi:hypothetical protein
LSDALKFIFDETPAAEETACLVRQKVFFVLSQNQKSREDRLGLVVEDFADNGGRCNILGCGFHAESAEEAGSKLVPIEGEKVKVVDLGF